jgi:hexosaminidase
MFGHETRARNVLYVVCLLALSAGLCHAGSVTLPLMPFPASVAQADGELPIDSAFTVATSGYSDARLRSAVGRLILRLSRQTGLPLQPAGVSAGSRASLVIECRAAGPALPTLGEDESYQLQITPQGARLMAPSTTGALRGMETFAQLVAAGPKGFRVPAVRTEDRPRFPWRGIMLDVSRHWMPAPVIERNLEAMAAVKMNVFHWHLSDDQGFRVESKRFPKLQQLGSDGQFYTQAEVRRIVEFARDRGIRVIPEFDIPGHTTAWFVGYPELASAKGSYAIERKWGIFRPTMDPSREETYEFLDGFLAEMTALFPDPYFHIGGDEVDDTQWKNNSEIQAFARVHNLSSSHDVQAYFNARVQKILKKYGKTMIGWDEALHAGLASDTVIQSWRGQASLADAARKGYRGVLSYGYYLDHLLPARFHYANDPLDHEARQLDSEQAARILGGEACMWTEYVSPETVDSRIWPRAAAIAERLWSAPELSDTDSMYARMEAVSRGLDAAGVLHRHNYAFLLDRLAGGQPSNSVRTLADAVEALGIEGRRDERKYSSRVPLNRLVDAARPESESVRYLEQAARAIVAGPSRPDSQPALATLRAAFHEWAENRLEMAGLAAGDFLVSEMLPLSEALTRVGNIGLQALEYLQSGRAAPETWIAEQKQALDAIAKPKAEVILSAVRPVRLLLEAGSRRAAGPAQNQMVVK